LKIIFLPSKAVKENFDKEAKGRCFTELYSIITALLSIIEKNDSGLFDPIYIYIYIYMNIHARAAHALQTTITCAFDIIVYKTDSI